LAKRKSRVVCRSKVGKVKCGGDEMGKKKGGKRGGTRW